jgi:F-box protein 25/32
MLNKLLHQLRVMVDCACWGRPLGSTLLWEQHLRTINRILSIANHIQIREVKGTSTFKKGQIVKQNV